MSRIIAIEQREVENILNMIPKSALLTVVFKKKDHTIRSLNGRRGVTKHLTSNPIRKVSSSDYIVKIYDVHKKAYRSFDVNSVLEIRAAKKCFQVK